MVPVFLLKLLSVWFLTSCWLFVALSDLLATTHYRFLAYKRAKKNTKKTKRKKRKRGSFSLSFPLDLVQHKKLSNTPNREKKRKKKKKKENAFFPSHSNNSLSLLSVWLSVYIFPVRQSAPYPLVALMMSLLGSVATSRSIIICCSPPPALSSLLSPFLQRFFFLFLSLPFPSSNLVSSLLVLFSVFLLIRCWSFVSFAL